jgi:excisionase family DNA binding protein
VSVRTIQRAIDRGNLEATRDGVHCWIRLDDLDRWQVERTTRSATARVVARDNDASLGATLDASADMPHVAPGHERPPRDRLDVEVERLRGEITDLKVERDRWHQAFERESALREEEMRELRLLLRQEQALSFSRLAAIEATTRHDTPTVDAPSSPPTDEPAETARPSAQDVTAPQDAPAPDPDYPMWRRLLNRLGGSS